jgi:hypothetical protein
MFGNIFYLTDPDYKKGTLVIRENLLSLAREMEMLKNSVAPEPVLAYK